MLTTLIVRPTDNGKWMLALPSGKKVCTFRDEFTHTLFDVRYTIHGREKSRLHDWP